MLAKQQPAGVQVAEGLHKSFVLVLQAGLGQQVRPAALSEADLQRQ